jgi:hypothetical protein
MSKLTYVPGPVYAKDQTGRYLFVNQKFYEVVPVPDGDITKMKTCFEVVLPRAQSAQLEAEIPSLTGLYTCCNAPSL